MAPAQQKAVKRKADTTADANPAPKKAKKATATKTTRKSAAKVAESDEEAAISVHKQLTDEELTKLKKSALASYRSEEITNVHVIWAKTSMTEGTPQLAGYLKFKNTTELRDFWTTGPAATGPLNDFRLSRMQAFGVTDADPDKIQISTRSLWLILRGRSQSKIEPTLETLNVQLPLPPNTKLCTNKERPILVTMITMHRLIVNFPDHFDEEPADRPDRLGPHLGENWYRALMLVTGYWRYLKKIMKPFDDHLRRAFNDDGSWAASTKAQDKPAEPPIFLTADDWAGIISDNQQQLSNPNQSAIGDLMRAGEQTYQLVSDGLAQELRHDEDTMAWLTALSKFWTLNDEAPKRAPKKQATLEMNAENLLVPLKPEACEKFLEETGKQCHILYPLHDDDLSLPFGNAPAPEPNAEAARLAEDAQIVRDLQEANAKGSLGPESARATPSQFWRWKRAMNQAGAKAPTLEEACTYLGYDINEVRVYNQSLPKVPPKGTFYPYPWQVVGAAWLIMVEKSLLHGGLLADEPGVGKTLTALLAIESSVRLREQSSRPATTANLSGSPDGNPASSKAAKQTGSPAGESRQSPAGDLVGKSADPTQQSTAGDPVDKPADPTTPSPENDPAAPPADHHPPIPRTTYKPTLIVVPSLATGVWGRELRRFPNLTVFYYLGSPSHLKGSSHLYNAAQRTLPHSVYDLRRQIYGLDRHDPQTGRTVFLTTYGAWHHRTLGKDAKYSTPQKPKPLRAKAKIPKGADEVPSHDDSDPEEDTDDEEMTESEAMKYVSLAQGLFYRVVLDESHKVRSPKTKTGLAILKLGAIVRFFLSATPMINKPADLYGALVQLYHEAWTRTTLEPTEEEDESGNPVMAAVPLPPSIHDFTQAQENLDDISLGTLPQYVYLLHPSSFWKMSHPPGGGQMDALTASKVLPPILRQIQLRRAMGDTMIVNDEEVMIGQDIPPYEIVTVELRLSAAQKDFYNLTHGRLVGILGKGVDQESREGRMNMTAHRTLCHAVADGRLSTMEKRLASRDGLNVGTLNTWHEQSLKDRTYLYWAHTTRNPTDLPHIDCMTNAYYIALMSPKMQYLARLLRYVCFELKEKIIIFVDWPSTLFVYKLFMDLVGVKHVAIMASQKPSERDELINLFNDKGNDTMALLASQRTSNSSLNLQPACRFMAIMEGFASVNDVLQALGRIFRIGQLLAQKIWLVTADQTYDQKIQHRAALKMIGQIAAQNLDADVDHDLDEDADDASVDMTDWDEEEKQAYRERQGIEAAAKVLLQKVLGQRTSRADKAWGDVNDLEAKDFLDENLRYLARFNLTQGVSRSLRDHILRMQKKLEREDMEQAMQKSAEEARAASEREAALAAVEEAQPLSPVDDDGNGENHPPNPKKLKLTQPKIPDAEGLEEHDDEPEATEADDQTRDDSSTLSSPPNSES